MLRLPVLVRGINNLSDARYCAGMGADGLIFTLDPTLPGAVNAATVKELASWVAGVKIIGEFDTLPVSEINRLVEECALEEILLANVPNAPLTVPGLLQVDSAAELATVQQQLTATFPAGFGLVVSLESPYPDAATQQALAEVTAKIPLWLGGPIHPGNALALLATIQPAGLILQGGNELKPGLRDFTELEAVFEALEEE